MEGLPSDLITLVKRQWQNVWPSFVLLSRPENLRWSFSFLCCCLKQKVSWILAIQLSIIKDTIGTDTPVLYMVMKTLTPALILVFRAADAEDLLSHMLRPKPEERMRLEQCLAHPWFDDAERELNLSDALAWLGQQTSEVDTELTHLGKLQCCTNSCAYNSYQSGLRM